METTKKNVSELDTENNAKAVEIVEQAAAPTDNERYAGIKTFAYVGPSLPGGMLKSNTILSGTYAEITAYYKDAIALYPSAEKLIVPVSRLAESREKTRHSGNIMHKQYEDIAAAIKEKGEKE